MNYDINNLLIDLNTLNTNISNYQNLFLVDLSNLNVIENKISTLIDLTSISKEIEILENFLVPTITILGDNPLTLEVLSQYQEFGAIALDNLLNDISVNINVTDLCMNVIGRYKIVYTATDQWGNQVTATRVVNVVDTTSPVITISGDNPLTLEVLSQYIEFGATALDSYSGVVNVIVDASDICMNSIGSYNVLYTASDQCGNQVSATRIVNVVDANNYLKYILPDISINSLDKNNLVNMVYNSYKTTFKYNNSLELTNDFSIKINNIDKIYRVHSLDYTITNIVVFVYGFSNEIIEIIDSSINIDNSYNYATITNTTVVNDLVNLIINQEKNYRLVIINGKYDLSSNINDPSLVLLGDNPYTLIINNSFTDPGATASDSKGNELTSQIINYDNIDNTTIGMYEKLYIVSDASYNQTIKSRIINVAYDLSSISIVLDPSVVFFEVYANTGIEYSELSYNSTNIISSTEFDYQDLVITISNNVISNQIGTYTVVYTVSDPNGVTSTATRLVNVVDTTSPVITISGDNPLTLEVLSQYIEFGATALDSYSGVVNVIVDASDICMNSIGSYNVLYTASDQCGNQVYATRVVNVVDTTSLIITISGDNPLTLEYGEAYVELGATAYDLLDGSFAVTDISLGNLDVNVAGTYNVIYTATDSSGNIATATRVVVINQVNVVNKILLNPSVIDYQIPKYYELESNGTITYPYPPQYYKAYCAPTSFANLLNYYNDISKQNIAIQLNYTAQNSTPPLTDYIFNYKSRPLTATKITDPNKIDIGYMLNTNAHGYDISDGSWSGTKLTDFKNFVEFLNITSPNLSYRYRNIGVQYDISYAFTNISGDTIISKKYSPENKEDIFNEIKNEISNNRPLILSFTHWNIVENSTYTNYTLSGETVWFYDFSGQVTSTLNIQSHNPIYQNAEYIDEVWDPEAGLGHTVTCVGYMSNYDSSVNSDWLIVQDNINNINLSSTNRYKTPKYLAVQFDLSYLAMITTLDISYQIGQPTTNLLCLSQTSQVNVVNINGGKYIFNGLTTYDSTLNYGLFNGVYTIQGITSGHPFALLNRDVSNLISYTGTRTTIDIVVSGGNFGSPYYTFSPDINSNSFSFIPGYTYRFVGQDISSSHPFYITDGNYGEASGELDITGSSITGTQEFTMEIPYNFTKSSIKYYCTAHSSMQKDVNITTTLIDGNYYNFYYGDIVLTVSGDFGIVSGYCYYHGHMGLQNKLVYTNVCNPYLNYVVSSNVSSVPSGYNGTIRLYDIAGQGQPLDFSYSEINNTVIEHPGRLLSFYVEDNLIYIKTVDPLYENYKLGGLIFNLYDYNNVLINASINTNAINLVQDKYSVNINNQYFIIEPSPGTPGEEYISITQTPIPICEIIM